MKRVINNALVVLCLFAFTLSIRAADHFVSLGFSISPDELHVNVGDNVYWTTLDSDDHSVFSINGKWAPLYFLDGEEGETQGLQFNTVGNFAYTDQFTGDTALIVVSAGGPANIPPTVSLTSPTNNAVFGELAHFTVTANAADSDGSVASVQFFLDATDLGTDSEAPFTMGTTNISAGTYLLSAVATDNQGDTAVDSVTIVVIPRSTIYGMAVTAGKLGFQMDVLSGRSHVVEFSTNLTHWTAISTNFVAGSTFNYTDTNSVNGRRFYRVETR